MIKQDSAEENKFTLQKWVTKCSNSCFSQGRNWNSQYKTFLWSYLYIHYTRTPIWLLWLSFNKKIPKILPRITAKRFPASGEVAIGGVAAPQRRSFARPKADGGVGRTNSTAAPAKKRPRERKEGTGFGSREEEREKESQQTSECSLRRRKKIFMNFWRNNRGNAVYIGWEGSFCGGSPCQLVWQCWGKKKYCL